MRRILLAICVSAAVAGMASGDIVHLRDGSTREGRIVSQDDNVVILEVTAGTAKARITIDQADVERIEVKATAHQLLQAEYKRRLAALDRTDADPVIAAAKWCQSKRLFREAEALLTKLAEQGGENFRRGKLALANLDYERKRFDVARRHLDELLEKHPKDLDAKLLVDLIKDEERQALAKLLGDAVDDFGRGKFSSALRKAEGFHDRATTEDAKDLIGKVTFPEGMKFEAFAAEARLHVPCTHCKGGVERCSACKGKGVGADGVPCRACGGSGKQLCDRCGGTGISFSDVPDWQLQAVVRALERRASADTAEFDKALVVLKGSPQAEAIVVGASAAELYASRAGRWLEELNALSQEKPGVTTRQAREEGEKVRKAFRKACAELGDLFGTRGRTTWHKAETADTGLFSLDKKVREARDDVIRALYFYGRTHPGKKDPYPPTVEAREKALQPLLAQLNKVVDHNAKLAKVYEVVLKNCRQGSVRGSVVLEGYHSGRLQGILALLVDLVGHASKPDLAYFSSKLDRELHVPLADLMAICRFELGKEKGKFGDTTAYERPAFVKKLLNEAGRMANLAHAGYERMKDYRDRGRRNMVPTSLVRSTREEAEDARRWYRAVFDVPYPLSTAKREEIDDQIDYMSEIISACKRWYTGGSPTPVP